MKAGPNCLCQLQKMEKGIVHLCNYCNLYTYYYSTTATFSGKNENALTNPCSLCAFSQNIH